MKKKTLYDKSLDELISEAYYLSIQLNEILNRMIWKRKHEQLTKVGHAKSLLDHLNQMAKTLNRLSQIDYEADIEKSTKELEAQNKWFEEVNRICKKPKR